MGSLAKQTDREPTATDTATMLGLALIASLAAAASAMPTADPQYMYYVPANSYVQPQAVYQPQVAYVQQPQVVAQPKTETAVKPTMYAAQPVAQPVAEPFLFGNMMGGGMYGGYRGMGWLGSNNMGGKAEYGDYGSRKYPTYGDYYRTHRYPINDGWMLWDEDLRDMDSKSNKIGSGTGGK